MHNLELNQTCLHSQDQECDSFSHPPADQHSQTPNNHISVSMLVQKHIEKTRKWTACFCHNPSYVTGFRFHWCPLEGLNQGGMFSEMLKCWAYEPADFAPDKQHLGYIQLRHHPAQSILRIQFRQTTNFAIFQFIPPVPKPSAAITPFCLGTSEWF